MESDERMRWKIQVYGRWRENKVLAEKRNVWMLTPLRRWLVERGDGQGIIGQMRVAAIEMGVDEVPGANDFFVDFLWFMF
jgi:hypothetical protein